MSKKIKVTTCPTSISPSTWTARQAIAEYLNAIVEDGDAALLAAALGDIAKARGMAEMPSMQVSGAKHLYKALRPGCSRARRRRWRLHGAGLEAHGAAGRVM